MQEKWSGLDGRSTPDLTLRCSAALMIAPMRIHLRVGAWYWTLSYWRSWRWSPSQPLNDRTSSDKIIIGDQFPYVVTNDFIYEKKSYIMYSGNNFRVFTTKNEWFKH